LTLSRLCQSHFHLVGVLILATASCSSPHTATLQGKSGYTYEIISRETRVASDGKLLVIKYLALNQNDVREFENAAADLMPAIIPEAEAGNCHRVAILAEIHPGHLGPFIYYTKQPGGAWQRSEQMNR